MESCVSSRLEEVFLTSGLLLNGSRMSKKSVKVGAMFWRGKCLGCCMSGISVVLHGEVEAWSKRDVVLDKDVVCALQSQKNTREITEHQRLK